MEIAAKQCSFTSFILSLTLGEIHSTTQCCSTFKHPLGICTTHPSNLCENSWIININWKHIIHRILSNFKTQTRSLIKVRHAFCCICGCEKEILYLIWSLSHKLLSRHFPDGRYCDDPSDVSIIKICPCLVTQFLYQMIKIHFWQTDEVFPKKLILLYSK